MLTSHQLEREILEAKDILGEIYKGLQSGDDLELCTRRVLETTERLSRFCIIFRYQEENYQLINTTKQEKT